MREMNVYVTSVGKPKGKGPLRTHRRRWENNIKMYGYFREIEWEVVDWIHLAQDTDQWQAVITRY
jgi:hypothetical protein